MKWNLKHFLRPSLTHGLRFVHIVFVFFVSGVAHEVPLVQCYLFCRGALVHFVYFVFTSLDEACQEGANTTAFFEHSRRRRMCFTCFASNSFDTHAVCYESLP